MHRDMGHARLATTRLSLHLPHKGQEDAIQRLNTVLRGLPSCPRSPQSSPPMAQSPSPAPPTCLLHTAKLCGPSAPAAPVPTATASLPANAVANTTVSRLLVAIAIVHRVSPSRHGSGSSNRSPNRSQGRTASSPLP